MPNILKPNSTIGIFGGGQLGQMTCAAAHKLGYKAVIFSDVADAPASLVCDQVIVANYLDEKALAEFASKIDIATLEFENIPTQAVDFIAKLKRVFPGSDVLRITQNRLKEKDFVNQIGIKTTDYLAVSSLQDLQKGFEEFAFRAILKTTTMGYDGKGQKVLKKGDDLEKILQEFNGAELILEKFADFEQEISVIVARSVNGEIACYQPLTNIHKNGILDKSIYPAKVSEITAARAVAIAKKIADELDLIGLLAVEFFVLKNGQENNNLLVNEMAPRPHNSGHFSMDACNTSQFEQLVRAITGLPLGNVDFHSQGYMQNLIGEDVLKAGEYLDGKKGKLHLYGKDKIAAGRKMGHINFLQ
jgi:5-(carboxyamino)imidazole ribonucleotide synthase